MYISIFDLPTPFDSQNHEIILDKSSHYGIEGQVNHVLFVLNRRHQYVEYGNAEPKN